MPKFVNTGLHIEVIVEDEAAFMRVLEVAGESKDGTLVYPTDSVRAGNAVNDFLMNHAEEFQEATGLRLRRVLTRPEA